jgi:nucleoside-diphosphate-sugar epimerase
MKIFVAGAAGAIGQRLVAQLVANGHEVTATTRSSRKFDDLRALGADPVALDGLDAAAVGEAVSRAEPDVIVHQMSALAGGNDLKKFDKWFHTTNELRTAGTKHLLAAADAAGVRKFVAQSYTGWTNPRVGGPVKTENDPLDHDPARWQRETIEAIRFVESVVPTAQLEGIVLRYGNFYGPGASDELVSLVKKRKMPMIGNGAGIWSWIHLDDAAAATVAAVERGNAGIYNIVDDEPAPVCEWLPYLAECVGAKRPMRLPTWVGRMAAGETTVRWMTEARGASNSKAKSELDWHPAWATWRTGFRHALTDAGTFGTSGTAA